MQFILIVIIVFILFKFKKKLAKMFDNTKESVAASVVAPNHNYSPAHRVTRYIYNDFRPTLGLIEVDFRNEFGRLIPKILANADINSLVSCRDLVRIYHDLPAEDKDARYGVILEIGLKSMNSEERLPLPELLYAVKGGLS